MRLLICAGGTGGGVYPALAVLQALENEIHEDSPPSVLWVGSEGGMERELVMRAGISFVAIPAAGVHGVGLRELPRNISRLVRGYLMSKKILRRFNPDVLFFTGGYIAVPVAVAGRKRNSLLFIPDIEPGLALKFLQRFSDRVALTVAESQKFLKNSARGFVSGYPVRAGLKMIKKQDARDFYNFRDKLPVLLVMGGSSGARSINQALLQALPAILPEIQVIHICGTLDWEAISKAHSEMLNKSEIAELVSRHYRVFPYLHEDLEAAYSAADMIVSRAGASILGELPMYGIPAILVPYPYAWRYQQENAEYLVRCGAARIIPDEELPQRLVEEVRRLIFDSTSLDSMSQAMQRLANPDAAARIARELMVLGRKSDLRRITP